VQLRRFRPADIAAVLRIESASFPEDAYPEEFFRQLYHREPGLFLLALEKRRIIAYIVGAVDGLTGRIVSLAVEPPYRRRGAGNALTEELLRDLRRAGVAWVDLETRVDNEAGIRFWERLGFKTMRLLPDYYNDGTDALLMRKTLESARPSG